MGLQNDEGGKCWIYSSDYKKTLKDGETCTIQVLKEWSKNKPNRTEVVSIVNQLYNQTNKPKMIEFLSVEFYLF